MIIFVSDGSTNDEWQFDDKTVNASDKSRWTELMKAYANFYEVEVDDTALATTWNWIEDPNNSFWCTLAEQQDGTIVGFTQYQLMHRSLSGAMVCYLSDLYVCLLYTSPSPRDQRGSRMPSSA